jgi:PST family polysaccharide transporter
VLEARSDDGPARRVVRNGVISLAGLGLYAVLSMATLVPLARGLGRDAFGEYFTLYSLLVIVQLLTEAGLSTVLTARLIRAQGAWKEAAAEALGLLAAVSLAAAGLLLAAGAVRSRWLGGPSSLAPYAALAVACAGMQARQFLAGIFRALERFEFEMLGRLLQGLVLAVGAVAFVRRGPHALDVALALLAGSHVLGALSMWACLRLGWGRLSVRVRLAAFRDWLGESVPLALADLFRRLTNQVDTLLLSALQASEAAVGIYNLACRPLLGLDLVPRVVQTVTFPSFVRLAGGPREALAVAFARGTRLLWVASLPLAVVISACAGPIVVALGGPEYADAAAPLRVLIWILALTFISAQFRFLFTALGRARLYLGLVGITFAAETALEAAFIPRWSYMGLCLGFLLGEVLFLAVGLVLCARVGLTGLEWGRLARAPLAAALAGAALWPARDLHPAILGGAALAATVLYFALCVLFDALPRAEVAAAARAVLGLGRRARVPAAGARPVPAGLRDEG